MNRPRTQEASPSPPHTVSCVRRAVFAVVVPLFCDVTRHPLALNILLCYLLHCLLYPALTPATVRALACTPLPVDASDAMACEPRAQPRHQCCVYRRRCADVGVVVRVPVRHYCEGERRAPPPPPSPARTTVISFASLLRNCRRVHAVATSTSTTTHQPGCRLCARHHVSQLMQVCTAYCVCARSRRR
jgi:hypothetical protein